jgi:hypothetical protein
MFEIKLYRNTHIAEEGKPETQWEPKVLTKDQEQAWQRYGLIGHMLSHTQPSSPQRVYGEVARYEYDFNGFLPAFEQDTPVEEVEPKTFMWGLATLIELDLVRVEIVEVQAEAAAHE